MTKDDLLEALKQTLLKKKMQKLTDLCIRESYSYRDLIDLTFYIEEEIAFRAAWILEGCVERFPERFVPEIPYFLECYPRQHNNSCRRHYTKIMIRLLKTMPALTEARTEQIIETTFEWIAGDKVPVAVKANCMTILFMLRTKSDWIEDELKAQIEFLMKNGTAAIESRGKKILSMLASK